MRVSLRKRKIANGRSSLYLEVYHNGKASYEFLKLYIEKPTTAEKRKQNKHTTKLAKTLLAKCQVELQDGTFGVRTTNHIEDDFIKYFEQLTERRRENGVNFSHWWSTLKQVKIYQRIEL